MLADINRTDTAGDGVGTKGQDKGIHGISGIDQAGKEGAEDGTQRVHRLIEAHNGVAVFLGSLSGNDRLQQGAADGVDAVVDDIDGHEGDLALDADGSADQGGRDDHDGQEGLVDVGLFLQIHADGGVEGHGQTGNDDLDGAVILGAEVELILDEVVEALLVGIVADAGKDHGRVAKNHAFKECSFIFLFSQSNFCTKIAPNERDI